MMDSFLQLFITAFTSLGLSSEVPVVSAETMNETWSEKHVLSIREEQSSSEADASTKREEPASIIEKTTLLALTDETLYWVVAVLDGDTLLVSGANRELFQVRLLAVDTNEINGPDSTAECYGPEAALFTLDFLQNRAVRLTADPANEDLDPYGRKLRYVDALQEDGSFLRLNDALLEEGMATFPQQYPVSTPDYFKSLEATAKANRLGLWGACQ